MSENISLLLDLYEDLEADVLGITPEEIAYRLKDGKKPLGNFNPYE